MKKITLSLLAIVSLLTFSLFSHAGYDRNKAVPVEKVIFGTVLSVRNIYQEELIQDKDNGWHTFGGALVGGIIGNQFGGGSGKDIATILGAMVGGSVASNRHKQPKKIVLQLVELMIKAESGEQFMVIQDLDKQMIFHPSDKVRMIYLANSTVRVDIQR